MCITPHESKIQKLGIYEDAVAKLRGLNVDQGILSAKMGNLNIALPSEMEDKLRPLVGKRISILHTDVPGKEYVIRNLSEEEARKQDALAVNPIALHSNNVACEVV